MTEEKKSSGAGKFILGAAIGALVGAVASKFMSSKKDAEGECNCDCEEECHCEGECHCDNKACDKEPKAEVNDTKKKTEKKVAKKSEK